KSDSLIVEVLDITPPTTTLTLQQPYFLEDDLYYVSTETLFVLSAVDPEMPTSSGVAFIKYQIGEYGAWTTIDIVDNPIVHFTIPLKGPYMISYHSVDVAGNTEEIKSINVIVNSSKLTYSGEFEGTYSDPVLLKAFLFDMAWQKPIQGKQIEFKLGSQTVFAETMSDGVATSTLNLSQPGGFYTVSASFGGDNQYLDSSNSSDFTIEKEHAYAQYTGSTVVPTSVETIILRATVFDDDDGYWGDLNKIYVTFTIYSDTLNLLEIHGPFMVEITYVDGVGVAEIIIPHLGEGGYLVAISFNPVDNDSKVILASM
ncbi:MAG: OmpL47-type beta-barrel domain-containing protein, partial [Promethearchaeota archaeon]